MSERERPREDATTVDSHADPSVGGDAARAAPGTPGEPGPAGALLAALSACDLATATSLDDGTGGAAAQASRSLVPLAARLAEARRALGRAQRLSASLGGAAAALIDSATAGATATAAAVATLREAGPRTEEVAEVVDHLEDVANQAAVAALNVSVEVSRSDANRDGTTGQLAEEVKRLADRGAAVARRMAAAVEGLRSAWSEAAAGLERCDRDQSSAAERARTASRLAGELAGSLEAASRSLRTVRLPEDARAAEVAARVRSLGDRLGSELEQLEAAGPDLPEEVLGALDRLEDRLRGLRGERGA